MGRTNSRRQRREHRRRRDWPRAGCRAWGRPGMTGDDAASLTALLREYGGPLCEITRAPQGDKAIRRYPHPAAGVFTAATVPAPPAKLQHRYDPAQAPPVTPDLRGAAPGPRPPPRAP